MSKLSDILKHHDLRLTFPRMKVFNILEKSTQPIFIHQIVLECRDINRTSVYRTLELFIDLGIVTIIPIGWKKQYELAEPFRPHHHHLQCTQCSTIIPIESPEIEQYIEKTAKQHDYILNEHHIELRGICSTCKKTTKKAPGKGGHRLTLM